MTRFANTVHPGLMLMGLVAALICPVAVLADPCDQWVGKLVSVQGSVEVRRVGEARWSAVQLHDTFRAGDVLRVGDRSRTALALCNETYLRLDERTTLTLSGPERDKVTLIQLLKGAAHFFSRIPRSLRLATPFVNGAVEGTEFFVRVNEQETLLTVFEGRVTAANDAGSISLGAGESALARAGKAPLVHVLLRPRDSVQWALYYPPILDWVEETLAVVAPGGWQALVRVAMDRFQAGDVAGALAQLESAPPTLRNGRFFAHRASLLLWVGRVEEASQDITRALELAPSLGHAMALQAIIALVRNDKARAQELSARAVEAEPTSAATLIARSYVQQANFDLQGALASIRKAVGSHPDHGLAQARLAELWLSMGDLDRALDAARRAVALNPSLSRTQTVLGFAHLSQIRTQEAKVSFEQAIRLDQADPLPRLGLGLALIREGDLKGGRAEIEVATILDPNASLTRSYLGKAYFEEKRDKLAGDELAMAKALDPQDPTPWFYDAIRKQTLNRPVEALQDLHRSMELNDNRAVYRSRLLLDEDLAARSASLARIYDDLGFQQLARVESWKSLGVDPTSHSAHRFLADSYATQPRQEMARVSELLQSLLLQPMNLTPLPPGLAESRSSGDDPGGRGFILSGAGPATPAFNEFNALFARNRLAFQGSGVAGGNHILGDEFVHYGVWDALSYSVGQFHYETDGYRQNHDMDQDIYNAFLQWRLSPDTSVQAEFRHSNRDTGDLALLFRPDNFNGALRSTRENDSMRLGFRHALTPDSNLIASAIYQDGDLENRDDFVDLKTNTKAFGFETQYLLRQASWNLIGGVGHSHADRKDEWLFLPPFSLVLLNRLSDIHHTNLYAYSQLRFPQDVTWTVGASGDFLHHGLLDRDRYQFNPKFGVSWNLVPGTTIRGAAFRVLKRPLVANQTIEPTQVAGFNQFFDDPDGTRSWRYGIAIDQRFLAMLYGGAEYSWRELEVPFFQASPGVTVTKNSDWTERLGRVYLYWTPHEWLALSAEYQYERFSRDSDLIGVEQLTQMTTHRLPLGINFFHPCGLMARLKATYVIQDGKFNSSLFQVLPGEDQFWVLDAALGYRLPNRWGLLSIEVRNLLDEGFKFQDTDPTNPTISPKRLIFGKFTLAF